MNFSDKKSPMLLLIFGALCISFAPVFVKMIDRDALGPTMIGFWRVLIGAVILFSWSKLAGHSLKISKSFLTLAAIAGFIFALDLFFWHRSIIYIGAGMATILGNTQVFGTAFLSYLVFKEKLSIKFFLAAITAMFGVVLLVGVGSEVQFTTDYINGIIFGLATGVVYACYLVTLKFSGEKKDKPHFLTMLAWVSLWTAIFFSAIGAIEQVKFIPTDLRTWLALCGLALVAQSIGWWAISTSLPKIKGAKSGLTLLIQPVLATVWGFLFFSEHLEMIQIGGAIITLVAIYVGSFVREA